MGQMWYKMVLTAGTKAQFVRVARDAPWFASQSHRPNSHRFSSTGRQRVGLDERREPLNQCARVQIRQGHLLYVHRGIEWTYRV